MEFDAPATRPKLARWPIVALVAIALAGCGEGEQEAPSAAVPEAVPMFVTQAVTRELVQPVIGTGTIAAHKTTDVGPRVDGIIEQVFVRVGDRVSEGDPLFKTRDIEFTLRVAELENQVKLAQAEVRNSSRGLERIKELHGKGVASEGALDKSQAGFDVAAAKLGVAEAQLGRARQNLEDAVVRAPFNGVVTRQDVYEGKFMATRMGGMGGGPGGGSSGVVQIMKIDIVAAIVEIPEVHLSKIRLGTPAKVFVDGLDQAYDSEVHILNDLVDSTRRTVEVRLGIANEDYAVKPGLFTRAELYPEPQTVLALARVAVAGIEGQRYVFVAEDGRAKRTPVEVRQIDAQTVEVLRGLDERNDVLIGPNLGTLIDGMPVSIQRRPGGAELEAAQSVGLADTRPTTEVR